MMTSKLLEVLNLRMVYSGKSGRKIPAVNNVSFEMREPGQSLAIVGESGCGKSSLAVAVQNLPPGNVCEFSGRVLLQGEDIIALSKKELNKRIRWKKISWVRQSPASSLNPVSTIGGQIRETLLVHGMRNGKDREGELLEMVGLLKDDGSKYPHQLSGGMQQRACIAIALALHPSLVILDEPTSALDVSLQGAIINLLLSLKREFSCSYIFITHDITLAKQIADFFAVMYAGRIVEYGRAEDVLKNPLHPYTKALLDCIPSLESGKKIKFIPGEPPDLSLGIAGCPFRFRRALACEKCGEGEIELRDAGGRHLVACHTYTSQENTRSD